MTRERIRGDCARQMHGKGYSLLPEWKGTELAAGDHCFSPENQTAPGWLCVFVPIRKINCLRPLHSLVLLSAL